jgi:hypothetical protein
VPDSHQSFDPFACAPAFVPAARREVELFAGSARVELVLAPSRRRRAGAPGPSAPAFRADPSPRILAEETLWQDEIAALTPNRYPFAAGHLLLWSRRAEREVEAPLLHRAFERAEAAGGTALLNSVGAAATVTRAHVHIVRETLPFLPSLPLAPLPRGLAPDLPGVDLLRAGAPFPCLCAVVRGDAAASAVAVARLLELRGTPAVNVVRAGDLAFVLPRALETPAPHFPWPLGAAELWGRWVYVDEAPFAAATAADLERALGAAGVP